ncbi:hypothetical protein MPH_12861 [Macrophomina phaseolina MS6]|uniref:Uncharacterized protein n=1 Tax=Macrophomina phaseolina (strain MS6) TaxID=1126212 RepID=K2RB62_MACPH|nr:hypothetical protein MPH_12861 [Macrophomina phaseolina MS6]
MRGNAEGAQAEGDIGARGRRRESSLPPVPGTASRVRRASSSHWNPPPSAVKAQGTPAAESSVLALSKFKRRKRQPSLLRMMQQSDVEDGGDGSDPDDSALTLDYSLGDFEPDHESTPLNLRKGAAALHRSSEPRTSSSRKRKLDERERVEEIQVPRSSPPIDESPMKATSPEHLYSDASELPDVVADTQPEAEQNEKHTVEDTAVAQAVVSGTRSSTSPLSSLPVVPEPEEAPAKRPRRSVRNSVPSNSATSRRKTKNAVEDYTADPLSSSDSDSDTATETPVRARTTRKKGPARKQKTMSLSTATLQSLLPRRRKKPASRTAKKAVGTFEIPSSDVEDDEQESAEEEQSADEDELQRTPAPRKGKKGADVVAKASDSTVRGRKGSVVPEKGKGKRLSRTYGRRQRFSSDKENQDGDASIYVRSGGESEGEGGEDDVVETSEMRELAKSKELEAAARKFKEVDDWEMEFESVDMGGASASSPWR